MKVGITGGRGFLAYNLFQFLSTVRDPAPEIFTFLGDVCGNRDALKEFASRVDVLVHLAAYTDTKQAEREPERCFEVNVGGTENALEASRNAGTKMIYVSSGEVGHDYGGPYSESKRQADQACVKAFEEAGQDVVIARPYNLYGYRQNPEKLIPRFIRDATYGEPLVVHGDGSQKRDYVFAVDCAEALWRLLDAPAGTAVDVATGEGTSLTEIAHIVRKEVTGKYPSITVRGEFQGRQEPHDAVGSTEEMQAIIGWTPQTDLGEGIRKVIDWYTVCGYLTPPPIRSRG